MQYRSRSGNSGNSGSWSEWTVLASLQAETGYTFYNADGGTSYQFQERAATKSGNDYVTGNWRITTNPVVALERPRQVGNLKAERDDTDDTSIAVT